MIFLEILSIQSLLKLFFLKLKNSNDSNQEIFYIDKSKLFRVLEKIFLSFHTVRFKKLQFKFDDLVDRDGINYGFVKRNQDILDLLNKIIIDENFSYFLNYAKEKEFFDGYLKKKLIESWPGCGKNSIGYFFLMIEAISSKAKILGANQNELHFLVVKRLWMDELSNFAIKFNIKLHPYKPFIICSILLLKNYLKNNKYFILLSNYSNNLKNKHFFLFKNKKTKKNNKEGAIVIDQIIGLFKPKTFWNYSIPSKNIIFVNYKHRIRKDELKDLKKMGMNYIALSPFSSRGLDVDFFNPINKTILSDFINEKSKKKYPLSREEKELKKISKHYYWRKQYWKFFFQENKTKIYFSHDKWNTEAVVAGSAIKDIGGISAMMQISYYDHPTPQSSVHSDIYFSFSNSISNIEKKINSNVKYIISTGYSYDYYFEEKKNSAKKLRTLLKENGAKKIISIFDGGASTDERWSVGITNYQNDYRFWLQKLLKEEWLGLIIKCKSPGSFRNRLGKNIKLLDKAIASGRCYFNDKTNYADKNLEFRVAEAAYASDLAIHFCLYAGTAGIESRLTGTPTLIFDRYNLKNSNFYKMGENKIVFNNWTKMWEKIVDYFFNNNSYKLSEEWIPIINDIDPFNDGKAAYRINSFLKDLLDNFKKGVSREKNIELATERYSIDWGENKIVRL